jgi:uncharacterized paraquat-inducible protein A
MGMKKESPMGKKADLQTCKVCQQDFAPDHPFVVKSERCPNCGTPVMNEKTHNAAMVAVVVAVMCLAAGAFWLVL